MSLQGRKILVLAADYFEESELLYPVIRLREENADVVVAGVTRDAVKGKSGYGPYPVDVAVDEVDAAEFDAVVVPGGFAPDLLRRSSRVLDLVRHFDEAGKPLAIVCHGGWVPVSAGILRDRTATSVAAIRDDLVNAGADWIDEPVVVDRNLISAQLPRDLGPWMKALITALA
ncbi:type 1 glutamine amidotransferase [Streptomyces sp. NBC_00841]|uniref:type 1 glutamine amidotransferase domain-containing protein n=1 Tax=Streptomyces sp. NBC_00841 TaxID=2975847 RepID=UPI002DD8E95E|nr:type 1 glutamine amidotransferase domain-containing protein [Streptomyces sp. NBC_00841]WRZ97141.1 type 1 glutamine amidotransferase [Streptomyces sp. NBC_00841]